MTKRAAQRCFEAVWDADAERLALAPVDLSELVLNATNVAQNRADHCQTCNGCDFIYADPFLSATENFSSSHSCDTRYRGKMDYE
jgi:hypothetical protein